MIYDQNLQHDVCSFVCSLEKKGTIVTSESEHQKICKSICDNFHHAFNKDVIKIISEAWVSVSWNPLKEAEMSNMCNEFYTFFDLNKYDYYKKPSCDEFIKKYIANYLYNTEDMSLEYIDKNYNMLISRNDIGTLYHVLLQIYCIEVSPNIEKLEAISKLSNINEWRNN